MKNVTSTLAMTSLLFFFALAAVGCAQTASDTMSGNSMDAPMESMSDDTMDKGMDTMNTERMDESMDTMDAERMDEKMDEKMGSGMK